MWYSLIAIYFIVDLYDIFQNTIHVDPGDVLQFIDGAMCDKFIAKTDPVDLDILVIVVCQVLKDSASQTSGDDPIFNCNDMFEFLRHLTQQLFIYRLQEDHVVMCYAYGELFCFSYCFRSMIAYSANRK